MASAQLVDNYKSYLAKYHLSLQAFDEEYWLEYLRVTNGINSKNYPGWSANDDKMRGFAHELASLGGVWNRRIQRVVPGILASINGLVPWLQAETGVLLDVPLERQLFFGEFPTDDFNAQATRVDGGYLVLVNAGLIEFISHMTYMLSEARTPVESTIEWNRSVQIALERAVAISRKYISRSFFVAIALGNGTDAISAPTTSLSTTG